MDVMELYPFSMLAIPADEEVIFKATHPTFHRAWDYGIVITGRALYLFSDFLFLPRWRCYPLGGMVQATFKDSYFFPRMVVQLGNRKIALRTPYDGYQRAMDLDRRNLAKAAEVLAQRNGGAHAT
jgi:hypothetical protein